MIKLEIRLLEHWKAVEVAAAQNLPLSGLFRLRGMLMDMLRMGRGMGQPCQIMRFVMGITANPFRGNLQG